MKTAAELVHAVYHSGRTAEQDWVNAIADWQLDVVAAARGQAFREAAREAIQAGGPKWDELSTTLMLKAKRSERR